MTVKSMGEGGLEAAEAVLAPDAEQLADAPGLGGAAAGAVGGFGVEDLGDGADDAFVLEVGEQAEQQLAGALAAGLAAGADEGIAVGAEEPGPDGALVVGGVAVKLVALVWSR